MPSYTKYIKHLPQFCIVENYFTEEEVDKIIDFEELQQFAEGKIGNNSVHKEHRDSDISWLHWNPETRWVFDKFGALLGQVNHSHFMYDIDGFDAFQYTKYKSKQHYNWHFDAFTEFHGFERKISACIMLTDPKKYGGGDFQIVTNGNIEKIESYKPTLGSVIFFASWMPHRVAPVKSGVRKSLVAWVMGKRVC